MFCLFITDSVCIRFLHLFKVAFQPIVHAQRSLRNESDQQDHVEMHQERLLPYIRPTDDLFKYVEPDMAGSGNYEEELRRYNLFMSSQGIICQNIRHFGGMYMRFKDPPEFDPDGAWYLCLDPEIELKRHKCVVYSVG